MLKILFIVFIMFYLQHIFYYKLYNKRTQKNLLKYYNN